VSEHKLNFWARRRENEPEEVVEPEREVFPLFSVFCAVNVTKHAGLIRVLAKGREGKLSVIEAIVNTGGQHNKAVCHKSSTPW
tara:strand:- start:210 stop:458 length:249 start_codon:yes stop_codon:yes gene_type:complete